MVQSGQAAKASKKAADAKPKVTAGKLLKDAALTAAMFAGPGKFIKGGQIVSKGVKTLTNVEKSKKKYELKASLVKKAIAKKNAPKAVEEVSKKSTSAGDVLRSAKVEKQAITAKKIERAKTFKPQTQAERGITSPPNTRQIGPQLPKKSDVTYEGTGMPLRPRTKIERPKSSGLKTTTGQGRKKVSDADARDVSKELKTRPNAPRARAIPRPGSNTLTANEKAQMKTRTPLTVTRKKPMSSQEIKDKNKATQLARTNRALRLPSKRKPLGPKTERQTKIIENAKKDTPRVPSHKVNVKIYRKKKWKPDTSNAGAQADEYTRPLTNSGKKGSIVRQPYKSKAEIRDEGDNANNALNVLAQKTKPTIAQGRGNRPQPRSGIPKEKTRTERREIRADRKRQQKARAGGPAMIQRTRPKPLIKRDASGKPIRNTQGELIVNAERARKVFPRAASPRKKARIQIAKVMDRRVKIGEKASMNAEKAQARAELKGVKKTSSRATTQISKRVTARKKLSKTRPLGK